MDSEEVQFQISFKFPIAQRLAGRRSTHLYLLCTGVSGFYFAQQILKALIAFQNPLTDLDKMINVPVAQ